jgi:hypothetical protein
VLAVNESGVATQSDQMSAASSPGEKKPEVNSCMGFLVQVQGLHRWKLLKGAKKLLKWISSVDPVGILAPCAHASLEFIRIFRFWTAAKWILQYLE